LDNFEIIFWQITSKHDLTNNLSSLTIEFSGGKGFRGKTIWDEAIDPGCEGLEQSSPSCSFYRILLKRYLRATDESIRHLTHPIVTFYLQSHKNPEMVG
jgi:hypothetical protein